ncbi:hypothetical protein HK098_006608, partial [Nowakowskiella sp. JEL0407]
KFSEIPRVTNAVYKPVKNSKGANGNFCSKFAERKFKTKLRYCAFLLRISKQITYAQFSKLVAKLTALLCSSNVERGSFVYCSISRRVKLLVLCLEIHAVYVPIKDRSSISPNASGFVVEIGIYNVVELDDILLNYVITRLNSTDNSSNFDNFDLCYVITTSGTTRDLPLRVHVSEKLLDLNLAHLSPHSILQSTINTFDPSFIELLLPFYPTSTRALPNKIVFLSEKHYLHPDTLSTAISQQVSVWMCTPGVFSLLADADLLFKTLDTVVFGGESIGYKILDKINSIRNKEKIADVFNIYGTTETSVWALINKLSTCRSYHEVPIGNPFTGTLFKIKSDLDSVAKYTLDLDGILKSVLENPVPDNFEISGRLFIGGTDRICRIGNEIEGEFWRDTGDSATLRRNNGALEIFVRGRNEYFVKSLGCKYSLSSIESAIESVDGINACIQPDESPSIDAFIYSKPNTKISIPSIALRLKYLHVPTPVFPNRYFELDKLTLTPNGKIDRKAILQRRDKLTELETSINQIWSREELALKNVFEKVMGIEFSFDELIQFDSNQAVRIVHGVVNELDLDTDFIGHLYSELNISISEFLSELKKLKRKLPTNDEEQLDLPDVSAKRVRIEQHNPDLLLSEKQMDNVRVGKIIWSENMENGIFKSINVYSGEVYWQTRLGGRIEAEALFKDNAVFIGCHDNRLYALCADTGKILDYYVTEDIIKATPEVKNNVIIIPSYDLHVYFLSFVTLEQGGKFELVHKLELETVASSVYIDDLTQSVILATLSGKVLVYSFDILKSLDKPRIYWTLDLKAPIYSNPCVFSLDEADTFENWRMAIGTVLKYLYLISWSGSILWKFDTEGRIYSSPKYHQASRLIYCGSHSSKFFCISIFGREQWSFSSINETTDDEEELSVFFSSPAIVGNLVVCASSDGTIVVFEGGSIVGRAKVGHIYSSLVGFFYEKTDMRDKEFSEDFTSPPIHHSKRQRWARRAARETVISGMSNPPPPMPGFQAKFSPGEVYWQTRLGGRIEAEALFKDNAVFIGCHDNRLYALCADTGKILDYYVTEDIIKATPEVKNNVIIIPSYDLHVYFLSFVMLEQCGKFELVHKLELETVASSVYIDDLTQSVILATLSGKVFVYSFDILKSLDKPRIYWTLDLKAPIYSNPCVFSLDEADTFENWRMAIGTVLKYLYLISWSGSILWKFDTEGRIYSSPKYHQASRLIYCGSHSSKFFCISIFGREQWSFWSINETTDDEEELSVFFSSPAIVGNLVVCASSDGTIVVFEGGSIVGRAKVGHIYSSLVGFFYEKTDMRDKELDMLRNSSLLGIDFSDLKLAKDDVGTGNPLPGQKIGYDARRTEILGFGFGVKVEQQESPRVQQANGNENPFSRGNYERLFKESGTKQAESKVELKIDQGLEFGKPGFFGPSAGFSSFTFTSRLESVARQEMKSKEPKNENETQILAKTSGIKKENSQATLPVKMKERRSGSLEAKPRLVKKPAERPSSSKKRVVDPEKEVCVKKQTRPATPVENEPCANESVRSKNLTEPMKKSASDGTLSTHASNAQAKNGNNRLLL